MTRQYSITNFFDRCQTSCLLAISGVGLFGDMDFAAMKEGKTEELFKAWLALPDSQRNKMDTEFRISSR